MPPAPHSKPRVGVPWRAASEEAKNQRPKIDPYLDAVRAAGGEPVLLSLDQSPEQLKSVAQGLDAFVLPGSPADVDPARYGSAKHKETADADAARERMDSTLLDHALATHKPVLAICYGTQLLNVYLGGSLVQDLPDERPGPIRHDREDNAPDSVHPARIESGRVAELARNAGMNAAAELVVNSSHHQAVLEPGRDLRVTAHATDGTIEGVEYTGAEDWIVGVQWHPERISDKVSGAELSRALFRELISESASRRSKRTAD
ncbi:MAG: gamma-glutamyl-gamma-aminobutyrate hydrolase family protein [Candidatus Acidiferrales bacterium]